MLRRCYMRLGGGGSAVAAASTSTINEVNVGAVPAKTAHPRSEFKYEGSTKGGDVGARNEAAFIGYQQTHPHWAQDPTAAFAMPHLLNLLTVTPVSVALAVLGAAFWGVAFWRYYAGLNFRSVTIQRPAPQKEAAA